MVIFHCYVSSPEGSINTSYYQVQTAASLQERHPSSHFFAQFRARKKQCHANVSKNNKKYHMLSYTMVVSFITMNIGIWCIYYHILSYTIIYYHIISYNIIYNIIYYHILTCPSFPSQYQISYQGRPIYILSGASCSFLGQLPWKSLKAGPTWAYGHMEAEPMMGISRD